MNATRSNAGATTGRDPALLDGRELLVLDIAARAAELCRVRAELRTALDAEHVPARLRERLVLVVDEACANIIRHAYRHAADTGAISLRVTRAGDMLGFELRDAAPAVDPQRIKPRDLSECRPGGLGVAFIDATMDAWQVIPLPGGQGNRLIMHKRLTPETENQ